MHSTFLNPPFLIAILLSLSIHEWAHGWAAYKLGDPTAAYAGRLTLNPLAHLDLMGALMFLIVGFGWAKPVPINPYFFRNPKRDTAIVSIAGPVSNFLLGTVSFFGLALLLKHQASSSPFDLLTTGAGAGVWERVLSQILGSAVFINFGLMAFNLLPIAPLDGSKVLHLFIPARYEDTYEEFLRRGPIILLILILVEAFLNIPLLSVWVLGIMEFIMLGLNLIAGPIL
ncbi:MAG: site-2 protease family protein [Candidatus Peribacteraceae bacterium]|nr:site-2 protease family protein [Candidatus Peribacteraceae bacterium]MDD5075250.1 site-2 protease family protein [Candidatus Peribacteraceae bacterium]